MIIRHYTEVKLHEAEAGASKATLRELISTREGAPNFTMRLFELEPGGTTPFHSHPWEHEVFVLDGVGAVGTSEGPRPIRAGDSIFIPGDEQHQMQSSGDVPLRFICVIPLQNPCDV